MKSCGRQQAREFIETSTRHHIAGRMRDPEFHHGEHRGHRGRKERVSDPDPNPSFPSVSVNSVVSVVKSGADSRDTLWLEPMRGRGGHRDGSGGAALRVAFY